MSSEIPHHSNSSPQSISSAETNHEVASTEASTPLISGRMNGHEITAPVAARNVLRDAAIAPSLALSENTSYGSLENFSATENSSEEDLGSQLLEHANRLAQQCRELGREEQILRANLEQARQSLHTDPTNPVLQQAVTHFEEQHQMMTIDLDSLHQRLDTAYDRMGDVIGGMLTPVTSASHHGSRPDLSSATPGAYEVNIYGDYEDAEHPLVSTEPPVTAERLSQSQHPFEIPDSVARPVSTDAGEVAVASTASPNRSLLSRLRGRAEPHATLSPDVTARPASPFPVAVARVVPSPDPAGKGSL